MVNLCTVYSEMGKHEIALNYVLKAVELLEKTYTDLTLERTVMPSYFVQVLATANYNAGVEYEFLFVWPESLV